MTTKYLDSSGLSYFWGKLKAYFQPMLSSGVNIKTVNNTSLLGSGDLTILPQLVTLSYGNSTWQDFINAYNANCLVYCRASSNSNPATGSQTRMAFMAYVNNASSPTEVEFQYYRSVSSHTESQQGDQVFVYKLTSNGTWTVIKREASVKVVAGTGLGGTYSNGTMTLTGPTNVSELTNDSGFITDYTETDPVFSASAAHGISSSDISAWNAKQSALGTLTVTLTVAGWSSDAQTVTATGVTSSNTVIISPSPSNMEEYIDAGIVCTAQGTNALTFECDTTPTSAIDVNVVII